MPKYEDICMWRNRSSWTAFYSSLCEVWIKLPAHPFVRTEAPLTHPLQNCCLHTPTLSQGQAQCLHKPRLKK